MSSNSRDRRRRSRQAAVLRSDRDRVARSPNDQISARQRGFSWRWVSLMIVLSLSGLLALFFTSDAFYIHSVAVGGVRYLTREEVFAFADIANQHIFWVSPEEIEENVKRSSSVADVDVRLSWPPQMVTISVFEREPVVVWIEGGAPIWLDANGRVMAQREDRDDLLQIVVEPNSTGEGLALEGEVDPGIVFGALQLQELLPDVKQLRYHPVKGLGYVDGGGWVAWFGTGTGMDEKFSLYRTIAQNLVNQGIQPTEINVAIPDYPHVDTQQR